METSKTNQTRWKWHHNTFTSSLHLPFCCHLHKYALCLLVACREGLWKAVGCVVHFGVHGSDLCWIDAYCYPIYPSKWLWLNFSCSVFCIRNKHLEFFVSKCQPMEGFWTLSRGGTRRRSLISWNRLAAGHTVKYTRYVWQIKGEGIRESERLV